MMPQKCLRRCDASQKKASASDSPRFVVSFSSSFLFFYFFKIDVAIMRCNRSLLFSSLALMGGAEMISALRLYGPTDARMCEAIMRDIINLSHDSTSRTLFGNAGIFEGENK